jgi:flagellar basal-body rod protein FlgF
MAFRVHIACLRDAMNSGYYAACTGLMARTEALDTIANNLANVSTAGFRGSHNAFSSLLATTGTFPLSVLNQDANDYGVLSGSRLDTSQGALVKTNNELDLAIEGPGYFAVQTAAGPVYTRGGNFRVSPVGQLVTAAGDPVMGDTNRPITIIGAPVSISADGTISSNYYDAPAATAVPAQKSMVRQGMLESSNVNPITSVIEMISAQREVETMRHVLSMINGVLDKTATEDLPRLS